MEQVKDRPILFSTEMVQAILAGRKTQTRRLVKPQPQSCHQVAIDAASPSGYSLIADAYDDEYLKHRYGKPGDLLWVREACSFFRQGNGTLQREKTKYKADPQWDGNALIKWKPSIHMPKAAARIWLKVKEVGVERVRNISKQDSLAEGVLPGDLGTFLNYHTGGFEFVDPDYSFYTLWKSIHSEESWNANPWVWVVMFEVLSTTGKP